MSAVLWIVLIWLLILSIFNIRNYKKLKTLERRKGHVHVQVD